ncbi:uncharacterized protein PHACADRAFT_256341 [Phanerochaete carnosa HHB-10118-sp]|uniref:Uncharacterized protein n=1 Tax=Phanerochaete carnosa (strain HHB-10118-sp) TaxID=650164 RepID=K5VVN5_PHACS|nr:uncharacterized protein PHACADRAFT_256341 [Phanerochaete carnosa HHB-10118-sp]EKM55608.1 hypothetical protein PHACADRAFT_256341 [Phanerochaete carnosa HHB-10118-sp]
MNSQNATGSSNRYDRHYSGRNVRRSIESSHLGDTASIAESVITPLPEPRLPDLDLPQSELDLSTTFESILSESSSSDSAPTVPELDKVNKRASNVLKLSQENEKLKEELAAMNARIEAAERKQRELRQREAALQGATKAATKS